MSDPQPAPVFRFAPSPNGELHLGHAYSALLNQKLARNLNGKLLLRIEDIDIVRCTPELEKQMLEDLEWLGVEWDELPRRQSEHFEEYRAVLDQLVDRGLVYPSTLSRGEIKKLAVEKNWPIDPDGSPAYPGNERELSPEDQEIIRKGNDPYSLRLDVKKARSLIAEDICWTEFFERNGSNCVGESDALG